MKAEANGNLVSDLAMPNRILSYLIFVVTKIAKGECRYKRKFHFRFGCTKPHPIFVVTKIEIIRYLGNTIFQSSR